MMRVASPKGIYPVTMASNRNHGRPIVDGYGWALGV